MTEQKVNLSEVETIKNILVGADLQQVKVELQQHANAIEATNQSLQSLRQHFEERLNTLEQHFDERLLKLEELLQSKLQHSNTQLLKEMEDKQHFLSDLFSDISSKLKRLAE